MKIQVFFLVSFACFLLVNAEDTPEEKPATKVCEPNSEFKKDCNTCKCNDKGTDAACELKNCPESPAPEKEKVEDDTNCLPGKTFKKSCNECTCPPSGLKAQAACTLLHCPPDQ